jgi:MYXO-CTERM domain-containing protein
MAIHRDLFRVCGSLLSASLLVAATSSTVRADTTHVGDAETLLGNLTVSRQNVYGSSPSYITWAGTSSKARTVCGTFVTNLLKHSYGWTDSTFSSWFGTTSPYATDYHDAIVSGNGFTQITNITQVQPGDIIAVKYPPGSGVTGHAMMVDSVARAESSKSPSVSGTTQYAVTVIDSSSSHHGSSDTRVTNPSTTHNGVGKGDIRVYVDSSQQPVGYSWSNESGSPYFSMSARPMAIGRIDFGKHKSAVAAQGAGTAATSSADDGSTTQTVEADSRGLTDDESQVAMAPDAPAMMAAGAAQEAAGMAEAGGCSVSGRAPAKAPASALGVFGLFALAGLLGWRRRRVPSAA